jgi:transposase
MWTKEHRRIHPREGDGYPSDLQDAEWARLEPMIPPARPGRQPRKTDMRAAMNAILYLLRTGYPWRLPAARELSAALDGLQHLSQVPA